MIADTNACIQVRGNNRLKRALNLKASPTRLRATHFSLINILLYNNQSYSRILIGSCL